MKAQTQRKLLGVVLVLGALGLGADRMFFSAKPADATSETESYAAETAVTATAPAVTSVTTMGEKLAAVAATELTTGVPDRDAFAVIVEPRTKKVADDLAATFATRHRLTAVVVKSGNRGGALVDGKLVTVGQVVDGLRLVAVAPESATFAANNDTVTLRMPNLSAAVASVQ